MPADEVIRLQSATWAVEEWKRDFPFDTVDWYLDLYRQAELSDALPIVLAAFVDGEFVGSASLIADDELPDAVEPGPWVAAVFVKNTFRRKGVGEALVRTLLHRATELHFSSVYLYTQHGASWYAEMGWKPIRIARLQDHDVTVMSYALGNVADEDDGEGKI